MKNTYLKTPSGFIALMSAIIISSVLILMMVSVSTSSFFARADSSRSEYKRISLGLAEACTNAAILKTVQNFNYVLTADPTYAPLPHNPAKSGVRVAVATDECYITSLVLDPEDANHRKHATVTVQAEYNGGFSNVVTEFTVQNPDKGVAVTPPTCALVASPTSLPVGKPLTLAWSSSPNATSITVQGGNITTPVTLSPTAGGTYPIASVANSQGTITYTATVTNAGGSSQCTATVTVLPPPPAPDCADVVMMLDRSGSMFSNPVDIPNEQTAATGLLNKYLDPLLALNPLPKVGVGRFGDAATGKSADIIAQLSNISSYASAFSAIGSGLNNNGSFTNIADAIYVADKELNSTTRHTTNKKKGIILVSDGGTNQTAKLFTSSGNALTYGTTAANVAKSGTMAAPSYKNTDAVPTQIFGIHFGSAGTNNADQNYLATLATNSANDHLVDTNTGAKSAQQTLAPNTWLTPDSGRVSDGAFASSNTAGQQQSYGTFGTAVQSGMTVKGIELLVDGLVTGSASLQTATLLPQAQGTLTAWTNGVTAVSEAGTTNCGTTPNSLITNAANARESVTINLSTIPLGATITSVDVSSYDKADSSAGGTYKTFAIVNGVSTDAAATLTAAATAGSTQCNTVKTQNVDVPDVVKAAGTTLEIGVVKLNAGGATNNQVRVGTLRAVVNYTAPSTSCTLGVNVSWNNGVGSSWSAAKTITLTGTQGVVVAGTPTDTWGHTWTPTETGDGVFIARITNNTCTTGSQGKVDGIQAKVYYAGLDVAAENTDGDHFFIAPTSADIPALFTTIGVLLCPAAAPACSNTINDDGDVEGADQLDPDCHTDGNASNATSYNPNDNDEWAAPPLPPLPTPPATPPNINIGSWQEKPVLTSP